MTVSIIIPTYNGKHKLSNLFEALSKQTIKSFEVILIIDGSTDGTEDILYDNYFNLPIKIYTQENKGRASVRNRGAQLATGELLIFFDDDMRPESDCIEAHVKHHQHHPDSVLTGGQIFDEQKALTDFQLYKCYLSRDWAKALREQGYRPQQFDQLYITAANFSIEKKLFNKINGFNELLRDCEDYDFAIRAFSEGIPIYYSEKAFAWHDDFQTPASFIKRQLDYKSYNHFLLSMYPERYEHLLKSRLNKPKYINKLFFSVFKSEYWINAMEKKYFRFLPRKIRYKIYTLIITAHSTYKEHL